MKSELWMKSMRWAMVAVVVICLLATSQASPTPFTPLSTAQFNLQNWQVKYEQWRCIYVSHIGGGITGNQLRVIRPPPVYNTQGVEDPILAYDTVSEGIGYGMIISAYANDQTTFNGLWSYAQSNFLSTRNPSNAPCMQFHILNDGTWYSSIDCATDAELDMVYGLLVAHTRWDTSTSTTYYDAAKKLANTIQQSEVEFGTYLLKPGSLWGGSSATNPSYLATGYFQLFSQVFSDSRWSSVRDASYNLIAAINTQNKNTGLTPDWCTISGTQSTSVPAYTYYYDAFRTPWRLAVDAYWNGNTKAINQCNLLNAHWHSNGDVVGDEYIVGGFTANTFTKTDPSFYVTALSCAVFDDSTLRSVTSNYFLNFEFGDYFKDSIYMLVGLFVIGEFGAPGNPLSLSSVSLHSSGSCPAYSVHLNSYCPNNAFNFIPLPGVANPTFSFAVSYPDGPWVTMLSLSWGPTWYVAPAGYTLNYPVFVSTGYEIYECICVSSTADIPCTLTSYSQSATPSKTTSLSKSVTPTISKSRTQTPSVSKTISLTPTKTTSVTLSRTPSVTSTPSKSKTISITPTPSKSRTPTISISATRTRTASRTPTISITPSKTKTKSITPSRSLTPSKTKSRSVSPTRTKSRSITPSRSSTPSKTKSRSITPSTSHKK